MSFKKEVSRGELPRTAYAGLFLSDDGFIVAVVGKSSLLLCEEQKIATSKASKEVSDWLRRVAIRFRVKIVGIGLMGRESQKLEKLGSLLWLRQDIVPHIFPSDNFWDKKQIKEMACAVRGKYNGFIAEVIWGGRREVIPSFLTELNAYKAVSSGRSFDRLLFEAERFKKNKGKMVFFSSTPAGGGVALMRHALIRLFRLLGVDVHWHVLLPRKKVFNVTKRKFHNILQAVASKKEVLSRRDKKVYTDWVIRNARVFKTVFREAKIIVVDDPQPSGLIPFIKKENPKAKIIYRSHIEIRSDLIAKKNTSQNITWNFIKKAIHQADVFVSHPIVAFIPKDIPRSKVFLMPATTDPLDGLNKKLSVLQKRYYLELFNYYFFDTGQTPLDLNRPYIIQIARFDPSKGIPDVIEAYRRLRKKIANLKLSRNKIPQLVIVGNAAIDDPEGNLILREILSLLDMDCYWDIANDIKVARIPHIDQMLNALLSESFVALQLSHREGFEVKISEALKKGKPVIAYKTGGIPLQISQGETGYLVLPGNTKKVSDYLYCFMTDKNLYKKFVKTAQLGKYDEFGTVVNATKWLFLANKLLSGSRDWSK